jgi:hypothetical protein
MPIPLKYNSSGTLVMGPVIKSTDGYTPLTGLTSALVDLNWYLGTSSGDYSASQSFTEAAQGYYVFGYTTDITGTVGARLLIELFSSSSGIPTFENCIILSANAYDALISTSDYLLVDIQQLGGSSGEIATGMFDVNVQFLMDQSLTTEAGANLNNFFHNNDVVSTERISELPTTADLVTTASNMNIGAAAGATIAGATAFRSTFGTAANVNVGAVAGATVAGTTDFRSTFSTAALVNLGAIGGATVATGSAQLGVNVVSISSQNITTDAADNWDNFWFNNDVVSTERVSELPTTADLSTFTTDKSVDIGRIGGSTVSTAVAQIGVNVVEIADETITTDAADNWDNFWFNNDVVSTERVSELPTTADVMTTASNVNIGAVAGVTSSGVDGFKADVTGMSTFSTATEVEGILTFGEWCELVGSLVYGDFVTTGGATFKYDDHGGTTNISMAVTTAGRTRST